MTARPLTIRPVVERKPAPRIAYSPAEVAERIGRHRKTVIGWIHDKTLAARQVKGKWLVPAVEVDRLLGIGVESGVGQIGQTEHQDETTA